MSDQESLQAEVERLRDEVESYRQRELADLRTQLAAAREAAEHYRAEALQVLENFKSLESLDREKFARMETEIATLRQANSRTSRERTSARS